MTSSLFKPHQLSVSLYTWMIKVWGGEPLLTHSDSHSRWISEINRERKCTIPFNNYNNPSFCFPLDWVHVTWSGVCTTCNLIWKEEMLERRWMGRKSGIQRQPRNSAHSPTTPDRIVSVLYGDALTTTEPHIVCQTVLTELAFSYKNWAMVRAIGFL